MTPSWPACPGHPRLALLRKEQDVDARDKRGHDAVMLGFSNL
jgi:hypothetical protein